MTTILENTTLTAIVRDEAMNPAGGVKRWLEAVIPHLSNAVVVDTGSLDGTRDILSDLEKKYSNLKVFDYEFVNYSHARNFSLSKVKTEKILVLDADELILNADFEKLADFVNHNKASRYNFEFIDVYPKDVLKGIGHNPRLFNKKGSVYFRPVWEAIIDNIFFPAKSRSSPVPIYHFMPKSEDYLFKNAEWYDKKAWESGKAPSQVEGFSKWKAFNPRRDQYE